MKKIILLCLAVGLILTGCGPKTEEIIVDDSVLTIYAYDSLTAEWGLLPIIIDKFQTDNDVKTEIISFADTGAMLNQLILEKENPKADIVIGLDNVNYKDVVSNELLDTYKPELASKIDEDLYFDEKFSMTPFDYGYIGFVYDNQQINFDEPISLLDLTSQQYKDKIIVEQAGVSSPGTQLMLWSQAALNDAGDINFKNGIAENVLTVTPDWSTAYYSMFLESEAPIVLSYLTSPAYHIEMEAVSQYKAIEIKEGYIRQTEGLGLTNNDNEMSKKFIDYMLSADVQDQIATTQWMFPVIESEDSLPKAYEQIIVPDKEQGEVLQISSKDIISSYDDWLTKWNHAFGI